MVPSTPAACGKPGAWPSAMACTRASKPCHPPAAGSGMPKSPAAVHSADSCSVAAASADASTGGNSCSSLVAG